MPPTAAPLLLLALLLALAHAPTPARSHGMLIEPPQRGLLAGSNLAPTLSTYPGAPRDPFAHFPAGSKALYPGAGKNSQERAVNFRWTPWTPTNSNFRNWRAGVCGDLKTQRPQEHLRGGRYYFGAKITRTYNQGSVLQADVSTVAHHNGFVELHVCDVARCGGEISEACFRDGHCHALPRLRESSCESRTNRRCPPIDPNYPSRWYMPCRTSPSSIDVFSARFRLPATLSCRHCVLHWFWTTANGCNPPGIKEYFQGPRGPMWGQCEGQGGALGGYTKVQRDCGGSIFPEEYYQCADISIRDSSAPRSSTRPRPSNPPSPPRIQPPIFKLSFYADGASRRLLKNNEVNYINSRKWNRFTFLASTRRKVSKVEFFIDGKKIWTDFVQSYFMMGNTKSYANYWRTPIYNRIFTVEARADGQRFVRRVRLSR